MKLDTDIDKLLTQSRWCYFIPPQSGDGGYIPALVIEGQQGYRMMSGNGPCSTPWRWGETEDKANEICDAVNARRGITAEEKMQIVLSTMPGNFVK